MIFLTAVMFWLLCFWINKKGKIIPRIGGGCFSSKKQPFYHPPAPVVLPTAEELFGRATAFGKRESPLAYGAREAALADLGRGQAYYNEFQPSSMDQALANQYFQNVFPDAQKTILNQLSASGIASSPIAARLLGRERGQLGFDIGSFLSNQGNERARYSLDSRLGIDPFSTYQNYLSTDTNQSNAQAQLQQQYNEQAARSAYETDLNRYNNQLAKAKTIGMFSPIGGAAMGGFDVGLESIANNLKTVLPFAMGGIGGIGGSGGLMGMMGGAGGSSGGGGGLGGILGGLGSIAGFGGIGNMMSGASAVNRLPGYGANTPYGTYNMGNYSALPGKGMAQPVYGGIGGMGGFGMSFPGFGGGMYDPFGRRGY